VQDPISELVWTVSHIQMVRDLVYSALQEEERGNALKEGLLPYLSKPYYTSTYMSAGLLYMAYPDFLLLILNDGTWQVTIIPSEPLSSKGDV
jgi:hypothetical protein